MPACGTCGGIDSFTTAQSVATNITVVASPSTTNQYEAELRVQWEDSVPGDGKAYMTGFTAGPLIATPGSVTGYEVLILGTNGHQTINEVNAVNGRYLGDRCCLERVSWTNGLALVRLY